MTPKQEKEFCKAMTKRLHWYEDILSGKKLKYQDCVVCKIFTDEQGIQHCGICPLNYCETRKRDLAIYSVLTSYGGLYFWANINKKAFEAHYNDLIRKIKKAGFVYE